MPDSRARPAGAGQDDDAVAEQAAQWIVALTGDDEAECARARAGFEAWQRADPRHATAARDMEQLLDRMQAVRGGVGGGRPARAALDAAVATGRARAGLRRVRRAGAALVLAAALGLPAWMALHAWPPAYLVADMHTGTGQWQTHTLADGTRITLASGSAVNLRYDPGRRAVELVRGEILVDVAHDAARPFLVETAQGSVRALGTRFVVDRQADATVLSMLESRVAVQAAAPQPEGGASAATVEAGQRVRITARGLGPVEAIDARALAQAWQRHQLVVSDQPMAEVLDALDRYRPGHIRYDREQIRHLRVSAVLPLDDTDRALQLLLSSFPELRMRRLTPWLVLVDAPGP
jgi:transmembrane sensor